MIIMFEMPSFTDSFREVKATKLSVYQSVTPLVKLIDSILKYSITAEWNLCNFNYLFSRTHRQVRSHAESVVEWGRAFHF
jgi:hypothetical protein